MPTRNYKRKPDAVNGYHVNNSVTEMDECANWCRGELHVAYTEDEDGLINKTLSIIMKSDDGTETVANNGDYIIKYEDTELHGNNFYIVSGLDFEAAYEA